MQIQISTSAKAYIEKKLAFYAKKGRMPRIVVAERSCSGAVFRLHFEPAREGDISLIAGGIDILASQELLDYFGGFELDLEQFFFASRLKIVPLRQSYSCNCTEKCVKSQNYVLNR